MKLHHVLYFLVLVVGFTAVICTYYFGIIPRYEAYQKLVDEERQLRARIGELEKKFNRTQPAAVIEAWREQIQPWTTSVTARLSYFDTIKDSEDQQVIVPEEFKEFPKFWYAEERRKRMDAFADRLQAADLELKANIEAYEPPAPGGAGWNPSVEEIENWLGRYAYACSFVDQMIDIKAQQVNAMSIWPKETLLPTPEGTIQRERAGYSIQISMEDFAKFLAEVHNSPTFYAMDRLRISKPGSLEDASAPIVVDFILNKTRFIPAQSGEVDSVTAPIIRIREAAAVDPALQRAMGRKGVESYNSAQLERMRAAAAQEDPGFFRGILRWFGL